MAGDLARTLGFIVVEMKADWSKGRQAGFERNVRMLDERPDLVLAFWDGKSTGTKHTIDQALRRSVPLEVIYARV